MHKNVVYSQLPEQILFADIYVPPGKGPFPGILVIHGGGWCRGKRTEMNGIAKRFAKCGYVSVNIDYRLAPRFVFPAQIHDCKKAVRWMRENAKLYQIDPDRIGVFGYSAGAHLAALLGTTGLANGLEGELSATSSRVQAVAAGAGPMNLMKYPQSELIVQFLHATIQGNPEIFRQASPIASVSKDNPPMFLYHGRWDRIVHISHTLDFKAALDRAGVPAELYLIWALGHIPVFLFSRSAITRSIRFFDQYLKNLPFPTVQQQKFDKLNINDYNS